MPRTQANREIAVTTPLGEDVLLLARIEGREELGRLFEYRLDLLSDDAAVKLDDLVGANATVRIETPGGETRYINGYFARFRQTGFEPGAAEYEASLVPWLWFLTRTANCRIFQKMTVPDIIKQVFRDRGFSDIEDALGGTYPEREYCVQYCETEFDFVSRLMEHEGIYYYFKHENGKHTLVLADAPSAHAPAEGAAEIRFHLKSEGELAGEFISEWTVEKAAQSGRYSLNDYNFTNPSGALESKISNPRPHKAADFEVYDYPGCFETTADGERYARIRLEELHAAYERAEGVTDERSLATGNTFTLKDHPRPDQNDREYLVLATDLTAAVNDYSTGGDDGEETAYTCTFTVAPAQQPFRPARITEEPIIQGPQTAVVVGKSGEEIWTDEHGRVKVQFHWDRNCPADENSSCWVRVAQSVAGKKWGGVFLPRIGQEVIVEFLDGDPDRPIITGRVYNGTNKPPYDLPGKATQSGMKSSSSKGGSGFNELRFEDKAGDELVAVHAQKDMHIKILNHRATSVGADDHLQVGNDQKIEIKNDRSEKVGANHMEAIAADRGLEVTGNDAVKIDGNHSLKVGGDVDEEIAGKQATKVAGERSLKADKIVIEAGSHITIKVGDSYIAIEAGGITIGTSGNIELIADGNIDEKATGNWTAEATGNATVKATANFAAEGTAQAEVKSPLTTVKGDATLTLKGGVVMIN
ncbi:MAG: type VI secretion system tip protein TssI/VgrG [Phycisphaerales bacterium]